MQDLIFIKANATVPAGVQTTTARRGDKWFNQVRVGDVVNMLVKENNAHIGRAVITSKVLKPYAEVLRDAGPDKNHACFGKTQNAAEATAKLEVDLKAAYGDKLVAIEPFTVLGLLPLNE